jgi:hypothetical protein
MSIKKHAVHKTGRLHLKDANDRPLYAEGADGKPDLERPMTAVLYSPGTPQYVQAQQARSNANVARLKKKGSSDQTPEEARASNVRFLVACTHSLENVDYDGLAGDELHEAVYGDVEIGFIADQVGEYLGDWANFT